LKEAIVAKSARDSGLAITPAEVIVTNGGKQAIYEALAAVLDVGDEVLLPAPFWTTYPEAVRLAGATPVQGTASETSGYRVSVEQLEAARTPHTRLLCPRGLRSNESAWSLIHLPETSLSTGGDAPNPTNPPEHS
jgi:aspartate/methionine/tyrosine aminotransferase